MDLGESYILSEVTLYCLTDVPTGIRTPYQFEVLVSEDGTDYVSAGMYEISSDDHSAMADLTVHALTAELDCTGRYIEIRVISYGWAFLGEIVIK